ncbi:unnamed protein product [Ostreobium quekettii]|uniref:Protein kinase domain-containing protein n=1 Tax=Ostreobium quekettii TaxID=121088 RepID=A0A8S1J9F9_9CHLO|nr:unnamed protein product [Ostreobium quekettii]|eukprot:evm.model.scf_670EXC.4 EVM.evm.TU.scf_670EXC.4   scf_670EXC:44665-49105(-)
MPLPDLPEQYEYIETIGSGTYGVVILARDVTVRDPEKAKVAIKLMAAPGKVQVEAMSRELLIHGAVRHPHIVPVRRCFSTAHHIGVVMDYVGGGRLFDMLNKEGPFPEAKARWIFRQLMDAVRYIHQDMNSMHRDIKLENIILADSKKQWPSIYLCDFGFARTRGPQFGPTVSCVGSPNYFAPEILLRNAKYQRYDGKKADIYSCGAVLFIMLYGFYPKGVLKRSSGFGLDLGNIAIELPRFQRQRLPPQPSSRVGGLKFPCTPRSSASSKAPGTPGSTASSRVPTTPRTKDVPIGQDCLHLLEQMLAPDPDKRISLQGIWKDRWFQSKVSRRRRSMSVISKAFKF